MELPNFIQVWRLSRPVIEGDLPLAIFEPVRLIERGSKKDQGKERKGRDGNKWKIHGDNKIRINRIVVASFS